MGTKIMKKGLLTPIKYITKIFDTKEPELQIGLPTDVKHLAHIGYDGPGASSEGPTWLTSFHSAPLHDPESPASSTNTNLWASTGDISTHGVLIDSPLRDAQIINSSKSKPRHSRRYQSEGTTIPVDSSDRKKGRKVRKKDKEGSGENSRMVPDLPTIPKKSKKKTKDKDGSTKPRRKEAVVAPEETINVKPVNEELGEIL